MAMVEWTCVCTVYLCGRTTKVHIPQHGTHKQMFAEARRVLRSTGWGADCMGALCDEHKASHRVGPA